MDKQSNESSPINNAQDIITDKITNNENIIYNAQNIIRDTTLTKEVETDQINKREGLYNDLINSYNEHFKKKSAHNRSLKIAFFIILMSIISILIVGMVFMCLYVIKTWNSTSHALTIILSGIATILATIIVLPMISCNYLFSKKEDKDLLDFILQLNHKNIEPFKTKDYNDDYDDYDDIF